MSLKIPLYMAAGTVVLVVAMLAVRLPSRIPEWAEERYSVQMQVVAFEFAYLLAYPVSWVKGMDHLRAMRYITSFTIPNVDFNSPSMKVHRRQMDGVPVEVFRPRSAPDRAPAIIFIHGGGWTILEADSYEYTCYRMAKDFNVVIISVDYRQAPEHPYPVPFEDCLKAVTYTLKNAHNLGLDPDRIAIAGDSAGGNLAAAVALRLSQEDMADTLPSLQFQVLVYPALQMVDLNTGSYSNFSSTGLLTKRLMTQMWLRYLGYPHLYPHLSDFEANCHSSDALKNPLVASYLHHHLLPQQFRLAGFKPTIPDPGNPALAEQVLSRVLDPYFCPLLAEDVSEVPPAYFIMANMDILRDEGLLYAERLRKAGVRTEVDFYPAMGHGFFVVPPREDLVFERTRQALDKLRAFVQANL